MIYLYSRILQQKDELLLYNNMNESQNNNVKQKEKDTIPFIWSPETDKTNFLYLKWLLLLRRSFVKKGIKEIFWENGDILYISFCVEVTQIYTYTYIFGRTHETEH